MDPIAGTETKIRGYELPRVVTLTPDQVIVLDGIAGGPVSILPEHLVARGVSQLPRLDGSPDGVAYLAVLVGGAISLYTVESVSGAFANMYLGAFDAAPTVDNQGLALRPGHSYFNKTDNQTYVFTTFGGWRLFGQTFPATVQVFRYLIPSNSFTLSGPDDNGHELNFDATLGDAVSVYVNGARQVGGVDFILHVDKSITFTTQLVAGNSVEVQVLGHPVTTFQARPAIVNTDLWIFDGVATSFIMKDSTGNDVMPGGSANCLVSIAGVVLDPTNDYNISGNTITFTVPPLTDAAKWMVVGLPIGPAEGQVEVIKRTIDTVAVKTYVLDLKAQYPYTIYKFIRQVQDSGSCTAKVQIDGVDVTGLTAMACDGTLRETLATALNVVPLGGKVTLVVTANSSALDLVTSTSVVA